MVLNFLFICTTSAAIIVTNIKANDLIHWFEELLLKLDLTGNINIAKLAPTYIVTACNSIVPIFTNKITEMEMYDYEYQKTN